MTQVISNAGHDDMIHDAVLDYYGRRLATCSSDRTIKIFEVEGESHRLTETLKGHEGAVWCVAWSHPKFGTLLASSSYDGRIIIWREAPPGTWTKAFDFAQHTASVNIVAWAPQESGCLLAGASSDGSVSVLEFKDNSWSTMMFPAHGIGVNSVSWAPSVSPGAIASAQVGTGQGLGGLRRFVTGGSDCMVKIWDWSPETGTYSCVKTLGDGTETQHTDWVRDVAWAPTILSRSYIASASQDKTVKIWTCVGGDVTGDWKPITLNFDAVVWRVSWSLSGNVLAICSSTNQISLWKERLTGQWENIKTIDD